MGFGIGHVVFVPEDPSFDSVIELAVREAREIRNKNLDYDINDLAKHGACYDKDNKLSFVIGRERLKFELTPWARSQFYKLIGVPGQYMNSLFKYGGIICHELARANIDTMLKLCHDNVRIRTCDGHIRGIVSQQFTTFDVLDVVLILKKLAYEKEYLGLRDMECHGYDMTEEFFNLRLTYKEPIQGLRDKDLHLGISLSSSDVGKSAIRVESWVYREVCTNGTYSISGKNKLYYKRHVSINSEEVQRNIEDVILSYPEVLEETRQRIREAERYSLKGSPLLDPEYEKKDYALSIREVVARHLGLSNNSMNKIAEIARDKYEPDLWGYCSAITEYAQSTGNTFSRVMLEDAAGRLLVDFNKIIRALYK